MRKFCILGAPMRPRRPWTWTLPTCAFWRPCKRMRRSAWTRWRTWPAFRLPRRNAGSAACAKGGVIRATVALLDGSKLGFGLTFVVMVELEREQAPLLDAFAARARAEAEVQQCYYVTGEADFCLICNVADMIAFQALTDRLFHADPNVRRFRTSTVLATRKAGLTVPLS